MEPRRTRSLGRLLTVGTVLVALAGLLAGVLAVVSVLGDRPGRLVAQAAAALADEQEIAYRGTVVDGHGIPTSVHVAVAADGRTVADLARPEGGRAELRSDRTTTAVRGDTDWWAWSWPGPADELANRWVADPPRDAIGALVPELLTPRALAGSLTESGGQWQEVGQRNVGGIAGIELWDGDRFAVVTAAAPHRLLTVGLTHTSQTVAPRAYTQSGPPGDSGTGIGDPETIRVPALHFDVEPPTKEIRDGLAALLDKNWNQQLVEEGLAVLDPSKDPEIGPNGRFGARVQAALGRLQEGMTFQKARDTVRHFIDAGAFRLLERLIFPQEGDGRIINKDQLWKFGQMINGPGQVEFLQRSILRRLAEGHAVVIEGCFEGSCADLVDAGTVDQLVEREAGRPVADPVEAVQAKLIVGSRPREPVAKASGQLDGEYGEPVAEGHAKVIEIMLGPRAVGYDDTGNVIPLGQIDDTEELRRALTKVNIYQDMWRDGRLVPNRVLVHTSAAPDPVTKDRKLHVFHPEHLNPDNNGPVAPDPAPAPAPDAGGGAAPAEPEAPSAAPGLFGGRGDTAAEGALADAALDPGGIDLTTLELRYLSEPDPGAGLGYSFSAAQRGPGTPGTTDLRTATLASDSFFVWLALDPSTFYVNLHPGEPNRIVDPRLGRTDAGRVLLEADLQMKKTVAGITRIDTPGAARFWDRLERDSSGNRCVPALRHWIVPGPATVHTEQDQLYILDAPLEVHIEIGTEVGIDTGCAGQSPAVREHNLDVYRSVVLPDLQRAIDTSPEYADLRRVYLSRVAAEWYRERSVRQDTTYGDIVGSRDATAWESKQAWSPRDIYDDYLTSYTQGEWNITRTEVIDGATYEVNYVYGGVEFGDVTMHDVGRGEFETRYPELAAAAEASLDTPSADGTGRLWLGSRTPAPGAQESAAAWGPYGYAAAIYLAATVVYLVLRYRTRRVRRAR